MPSSTSSSKPAHGRSFAADRLPRGRWGATWGLALAAFVLLVGLGEASLRSQEISPSQSDTERLWVARRCELADDTVVLAGASRSLLGIDLGVVERRMGHRTLQLSVAGTAAWPVLEHLADLPSFRGVVLLSIGPKLLRKKYSPNEGLQATYIRAWAQRPRYLPVESWLRCRVDGALAVKRQGASRRLFAPLGIGADEPKPYLLIDEQRQMWADYALDDVELRMKLTAGKPKEDDGAVVSPSLVAGISDAVSRIRAGGGEVVLLRMPSSSLVRASERQLVPRARFWDPLVEGVGTTSIHFEDYPSLNGFTCPDGSHLDGKDSRALTEALLDILEELLPALPTGSR